MEALYSENMVAIVMICAPMIIGIAEFNTEADKGEKGRELKWSTLLSCFPP